MKFKKSSTLTGSVKLKRESSTLTDREHEIKEGVQDIGRQTV